MTDRILKAGGAAWAAVRALPTGGLEALDAAEPRIDAEAALRAEIEALSHRVKDRDRQIENMSIERAQAVQEAEAKGFEEGRKAAAQDRNVLLAALERGIADARERLAGDLASLDRLAVLLAHESVERMIGDDAARRDLLTRMVRHQVDQIGARAILRISVSRKDFPDPEELDALSSGLGETRIEVEALDELGPGDCRIKLALGTLDIGIDQQWGRLGAALLDMAGEEDTP